MEPRIWDPKDIGTIPPHRRIEAQQMGEGPMPEQEEAEYIARPSGGPAPAGLKEGWGRVAEAATLPFSMVDAGLLQLLKHDVESPGEPTISDALKLGQETVRPAVNLLRPWGMEPEPTVQPSDVLGIENESAQMAANLVLQPSNILAAGLVARVPGKIGGFVKGLGQRGAFGKGEVAKEFQSATKKITRPQGPGALTSPTDPTSLPIPKRGPGYGVTEAQEPSLYNKYMMDLQQTFGKNTDKVINKYAVDKGISRQEAMAKLHEVVAPKSVGAAADVKLGGFTGQRVGEQAKDIGVIKNIATWEVKFPSGEMIEVPAKSKFEAMQVAIKQAEAKGIKGHPVSTAPKQGQMVFGRKTVGAAEKPSDLPPELEILRKKLVEANAKASGNLPDITGSTVEVQGHTGKKWKVIDQDSTGTARLSNLDKPAEIIEAKLGTYSPPKEEGLEPLVRTEGNILGKSPLSEEGTTSLDLVREYYGKDSFNKIKEYRAKHPGMSFDEAAKGMLQEIEATGKLPPLKPQEGQHDLFKTDDEARLEALKKRMWWEGFGEGEGGDVGAAAARHGKIAEMGKEKASLKEIAETEAKWAAKKAPHQRVTAKEKMQQTMQNRRRMYGEEHHLVPVGHGTPEMQAAQLDYYLRNPEYIMNPSGGLEHGEITRKYPVEEHKAITQRQHKKIKTLKEQQKPQPTKESMAMTAVPLTPEAPSFLQPATPYRGPKGYKGAKGKQQSIKDMSDAMTMVEDYNLRASLPDPGARAAERMHNRNMRSLKDIHEYYNTKGDVKATKELKALMNDALNKKAKYDPEGNLPEYGNVQTEIIAEWVHDYARRRLQDIQDAMKAAGMDEKFIKGAIRARAKSGKDPEFWYDFYGDQVFPKGYFLRGGKNNPEVDLKKIGSMEASPSTYFPEYSSGFKPGTEALKKMGLEAHKNKK